MWRSLSEFYTSKEWRAFREQLIHERTNKADGILYDEYSSAVGGSDSTYYAEYYDSGNRGDGCALFGGTGSLYLYMGGPNGDSDWESDNYTGTLSCKPLKQAQGG